MNCNCKPDIEKKLLDNFIAQELKAENHQVELGGYGITFTESATVLRGYLPFRTTAEYPLKKGGTRNKKTEGSIFFNYCPFCGVKA